MPHPDDETDEDEFERYQAQTQKLLADLEAKRPILEQRGDDVDAIIAEVKATWSKYEAAHKHADDAFEAYLQSVADQVDAGEEMKRHVREGITQWEAAVEKAGDAGSMERVKMWEGFQTWKEQIRMRILKPTPTSQQPQFKQVVADVLRMLDA